MFTETLTKVCIIRLSFYCMNITQISIDIPSDIADICFFDIIRGFRLCINIIIMRIITYVTH